MRERLKWAYEADNKDEFFRTLDSAERLDWREWDSIIDYAETICKEWAIEWLCM